MLVLDSASRGGRGRKLQLLEGRWDTRVKISDIKRCWTDVSFSRLSVAGREVSLVRSDSYQLGVELGETRLPVVVEDQDSIYHTEDAARDESQDDEVGCCSPRGSA